MAITVDAVSSANGTATVTSLSWSHTVAADADCLYVALSIDGGGGTYTYDASCTADAVSMTRVHQGNTNQYLAVFRLLAPTTGTITIQATWTGAQFPAGAAISLKGVQQTTPEGAVSSSTNASGSSYSHTIASTTGDAVLTFGSVNNNTSATASGTAVSQVQSTAGGAYTLAAIGLAPGGASVSAGSSWGAANRFSGASFNVATAVSPFDGATAAVLFITGSAAGAVAVAGAASATLGAAGTAAGEAVVAGVSAAILAGAGAAAGTVAVSAASAAVWGLAGSFAGGMAIAATSAVTLRIVGTMAGGAVIENWPDWVPPGRRVSIGADVRRVAIATDRRAVSIPPDRRRSPVGE